MANVIKNDHGCLEDQDQARGRDRQQDSAVLLALLEQQLRAALTDAETKVAELMGAFMDFSQLLSESEAQLDEQAVAVQNAQLFKLIEGLQFFDAHSQRVGHVAEALKQAATQSDLKLDASELLAQLERSYSTAEEQAVHDQHMGVTRNK